MVLLGSSCTPGSPSDLCSACSVSYSTSCSSLASFCFSGSPVIVWLLCLSEVFWFSWQMRFFYCPPDYLTGDLLMDRRSLSPLLQINQHNSCIPLFGPACFTLSLFILFYLFILPRIIKNIHKYKMYFWKNTNWIIFSEQKSKTKITEDLGLVHPILIQQS